MAEIALACLSVFMCYGASTVSLRQDIVHHHHHHDDSYFLLDLCIAFFFAYSFRNEWQLDPGSQNLTHKKPD